ncbi:MAG: zinc dependent phospholipase C family protein [Bacteroidota bacterium]
MMLIMPVKASIWGFYAHKKINRLAVFTLPIEMIGFYKHHLEYLTESAVNPDRRRYAVKQEAARHYIDIDHYGDSAIYKIPKFWNDAVDTYSEDTLLAYGIIPWHVNKMKYRLTDAMRIGDTRNILQLSADLGHYIADANVPLHTTLNYNGQLTDQHGIHGLWESRLTELFSEDYDFFVGGATYISNPQLEIWAFITQAHLALDTVFSSEKEITEKYGYDKKYSFETRGRSTVKVYSFEFSESYHKALRGMVERQMTKSVKMVGDFWYTCWVDAGQPDLNKLINFQFSDQELEERRAKLKAWKEKTYESRLHEY